MSATLPAGIHQQIEKGISILKQGGLVAYPTDTVYGLGALPDIPQAVERIFRVKQRPRNMALPLLAADMSQIGEIARAIPDTAWLLARQFLPGGLTLVLYRSSRVPDLVAGGGKTIAVRIPNHPIPIALIKGLSMPIVGTSANLSGQPSALMADEVCAQIGDGIDLIIDGGRCPGGIESTVVDLTRQPPVVLREGAISIDQLKQVIGDVVYNQGG